VLQQSVGFWLLMTSLQIQKLIIIIYKVQIMLIVVSIYSSVNSMITQYYSTLKFILYKFNGVAEGAVTLITPGRWIAVR